MSVCSWVAFREKKGVGGRCVGVSVRACVCVGGSSVNRQVLLWG